MLISTCSQFPVCTCWKRCSVCLRPFMWVPAHTITTIMCLKCQRPPSFLVHEHTSRSMLKGSRDSFVFMLKEEAHTHGRDCHFEAEKGAGSISEHVLNSWYCTKTHGPVSSSSLWPLPLVWQKRISLQTDGFCHPGPVLRSNSPVPLSCLYRHISHVEPQKKARGGEQEGNQRAGGCACGSFWERPG